MAVHVDESVRDAKAGLAYTYIHAGARKMDGNPHEPLSPDVKGHLQADVDTLYAHFVELVAARRRCSQQHVRAGGDYTQSGGSHMVHGGDVVADGIGLKPHRHVEQGDGSPTSSSIA